MANTVETVWKLILDEKEAREGESTIQRLARLLKDKLGGDSKKAIDNTTEAIKDQTEALKEQEEQARKTGEATSGIGAGDAAGKVGGAAGKLRGLGDLVGGGEGLGIINDIGDAVEGVQELGGTIAQLGPVGAAAGVALVVLGAVIADFAKGAQEQADKINEIFDAQRSVFDEIAGGATSDDIQEQIELLQFRRELEKSTLQDATEAYANYEQQIRTTFGAFGDIILGILRIIDPREEALASQKAESEKAIQQSEAKERAYNDALDKGLTSKADAKKAEEDLEKSRGDTAKTAEKAQATQEKAAADATRAAEQQAQKMQQVEEKRYQAAQKYGDAMVDVANKAADSARAALEEYKQTQADAKTSFERDLVSLTDDFQAEEREQRIARMEQEAADLRQHASKLNQIRDDAEAEETDLLRQRDFLGATRVRERANAEIEQENAALLEGQQEKLRAQQAADARELREFQDARQKRLAQFRQQNEDARLAYQRDLQAGREAKRIAERDAALARNRELRMASDTARALLGIQQQSAQAQLQIASSTLNQLRGMGNVTNNNGNTMNGNNYFNISGGASGMSGTAIRNEVENALGWLGVTR
jgi:hypothetical protein